ncbi:MAG: hypothetical protein JXQ92_18740 [Roseivirga sp.]
MNYPNLGKNPPANLVFEEFHYYGTSYSNGSPFFSTEYVIELLNDKLDEMLNYGELWQFSKFSFYMDSFESTWLNFSEKIPEICRSDFIKREIAFYAYCFSQSEIGNFKSFISDLERDLDDLNFKPFLLYSEVDGLHDHKGSIGKSIDIGDLIRADLCSVIHLETKKKIKFLVQEYNESLKDPFIINFSRIEYYRLAKLIFKRLDVNSISVSLVGSIFIYPVVEPDLLSCNQIDFISSCKLNLGLSSNDTQFRDLNVLSKSKKMKASEIVRSFLKEYEEENELKSQDSVSSNLQKIISKLENNMN